MPTDYKKLARETAATQGGSRDLREPCDRLCLFQQTEIVVSLLVSQRMFQVRFNSLNLLIDTQSTNRISELFEAFYSAGIWLFGHGAPQNAVDPRLDRPRPLRLRLKWSYAWRSKWLLRQTTVCETFKCSATRRRPEVRREALPRPYG
jgi:hypothetical protein